jgi:hemin uptake protein HemP
MQERLNSDNSLPGNAGADTADASGGRVIRSRELLQDQAVVMIEHQGCIYALRATRAGKLILTK